MNAVVKHVYVDGSRDDAALHASQRRRNAQMSRHDAVFQRLDSWQVAPLQPPNVPTVMASTLVGPQ